MAILQHTVESQYKRSLVVSAAHTILLPYLAKSGQSNRLALTLLFRVKYSRANSELPHMLCDYKWNGLFTWNFCWFESVVCLKHMQWCLICCVIASETDCLHEFCWFQPVVCLKYYNMGVQHQPSMCKKDSYKSSSALSILPSCQLKWIYALGRTLCSDMHC